MHAFDLASIPTNASLEADVCVVGSGPAGATVIRELANTGLNVVLLESGTTKPWREADALNEIENVGEVRELDQSLARHRILGGTSHLWGGRCASFDEVDYKTRHWVPHSGWPLRADDMTPYLGRSAEHLGLGIGGAYTGGEFQAALDRRPLPSIDSRLLRPMFWQFSRDWRNREDSMRFGPRLLSERADNVRVFTNATVVHVSTNDTASQVEAVEVATSDGRRFTVKATQVVLCGGGIENARLLLASNRVSPRGLGNGRDLVGRFLMDHPRGGIATFAHTDVDGLKDYFGLRRVATPRGRHLFCRGLRLSQEVQEKEGLLNCAVYLSELIAPDDPWSALKRVARRQASWREEAPSVLKNSGLVAKGLVRAIRSGAGMPRKLHRLMLTAAVEQRPDPDSRIMLAERTDRHGMPLSRVDWRVHEHEQHTVRRTAELVRHALASLPMPPPVLERWIVERMPFAADFRDNGHHIGTTRMSADPACGVVDAQCQVHGVRGLFVAGSSVFPTGGHANPTQMIVALAVRLADTLKHRALAPEVPDVKFRKELSMA